MIFKKWMYRAGKLILSLICICVALAFFALVENIGISLPSFVRLVVSSLSASLLTYWIFRSKLMHARFYKRFLLFITVIFLLFNSLYYSSQALNLFRGEKQFSYSVGNIFHSLSIVTHNSVGQWLIGSFYSLFPLSTQLIFLVADESAKVFRINHDFEKAFPRLPSYCSDAGAYKCFKNIYQSINTSSPLTNVGTILMVAVGAKITVEDKNHAKKKGEKQDTAKYAFQIVDLTLLSHISLISGGLFRDKLIGFPKSEVDKLPKEVIEAIKKLDQYDEIEDDYGAFLSLGYSDKYLFDGLSNRVTEAVVIDMVDRDIIRKFYDVSIDKTFDMLNKIETKPKMCTEKCLQLIKNYRAEFRSIESKYRELGIID